MAISRPRQLLFRIFYSTTFTIFFLILVALVLVSSADAVWQSYKNKRYLNIFIIAGVYVLTGVLAILILASRLYTNRSVLASIPKTYIPIEPGDIGKNVRKLIKEAIDRNAVIAYNARPKFIPDEDQIENSGLTTRQSTKSGTFKNPRQHQAREAWSKIQHPGWSSPFSLDLPNLQYEVVIEELPSLIEAKAVSLVPPIPDPVSTNAEDTGPFVAQAFGDDEPVPDPRFIDLLQRPENTSLRGYIDQLSSFGLINPPPLGEALLDLYEYSRFSGNLLTDAEFRRLMSIFAEILRGMTRLDPDVVTEVRRRSSLNDGSVAPEDYETTGPASEPSIEAADNQSINTVTTENATGTQRRHVVDAVSEVSAPDSYHSLRTAPVTQRSTSRYTQARSGSRPSMRPRISSGTSLRQTRSNVSTTSRSSARSGGSVIRLAGAHEGPLDLPYVISLQQ